MLMEELPLIRDPPTGPGCRLYPRPRVVIPGRRSE